MLRTFDGQKNIKEGHSVAMGDRQKLDCIRATIKLKIIARLNTDYAKGPNAAHSVLANGNHGLFAQQEHLRGVQFESLVNFALGHIALTVDTLTVNNGKEAVAEYILNMSRARC